MSNVFDSSRVVKCLSDQEIQQIYQELCIFYPGMDTEVRHYMHLKEDYARAQREIVEHNIREGSMWTRK